MMRSIDFKFLSGTWTLKNGRATESVFGTFYSSVQPRFLETQRIKEINIQHNSQDPTQTPQPKAISPSLLWPWNDHILSLFPHLHWEDKTHTELIESPQTGDSHWFPLFLKKQQQKQQQLVRKEHFGTDRYICLFSRGGDTQKHSGEAGFSDLLDHLHLMLEQIQRVDQPCSQPCNVRFLCAPFSPGFRCWSPTTPGRVQCHGFFFFFISHFLQREEPVGVLQQGTGKSWSVVWGQMWRISDSHSFYWSLSLFNSHLPLVGNREVANDQ